MEKCPQLLFFNFLKYLIKNRQTEALFGCLFNNFYIIKYIYKYYKIYKSK